MQWVSMGLWNGSTQYPLPCSGAAKAVTGAAEAFKRRRRAHSVSLEGGGGILGGKGAPPL